MKMHTKEAYIAKQVPPEYQDPNIDWDYEEIANMALDGNKDFHSHYCSEYKNVVDLIEDEDGWVFNTDDELLEYMNYHLPRNGKLSLAEARIIFLVLDQLNNGRIDFDTAVVRILNVYTDNEWDCTTIKGSCQGDWQKLYYMKSAFDYDSIKKLESAYFNLGTEWEIYEIIDDEENITNNIYCYGWSMEEIRQEIADELGCKPDEVKLLRFDGFERVPKYKEV